MGPQTLSTFVRFLLTGAFVAYMLSVNYTRFTFCMIFYHALAVMAVVLLASLLKYAASCCGLLNWVYSVMAFVIIAIIDVGSISFLGVGSAALVLAQCELVHLYAAMILACYVLSVCEMIYRVMRPFERRKHRKNTEGGL
jgi:hypothetical protein